MENEMKGKALLHAALLFMLAGLPAAVHAAEEAVEPMLEPGAAEGEREKGQEFAKYRIKLGAGYDSNAFLAPGSPYVDYYAGQLLGGANPYVEPQRKSGFFLPYDFRVQSASERKDDARMMGSARLNGRYYPASKVKYGNQYTMLAHGGRENLLGHNEGSENAIYFGVLARKHEENYTDHDTGLPKITTVSGTGISDRYNHTDFGLEASFKHRASGSSYGVRGQYTSKTYDDPVVVAKLDHTYAMLGADAAFSLGAHTRLSLDASYATRNYSNRHSHDAQGLYATANPLLSYSYVDLGGKLRHRISQAWQVQGEYEYTQRTDNFVHYNDYTENKVGGFLQYGEDSFKSKLTLFYLTRNYPNAFAFDILGQPAKTYSGYDAKLGTEWQAGKGSAYWAELLVQRRNTTDNRFAYSRTQLMAGKTWAF